MQKSTCPYPAVLVDGNGFGVVSQAGGIVLTETVRASGLAAGLSTALRPWRKPLSRHDPGKVITDLALSLAMGGDCLADVDRVRSQPGVFGPVASDPTVSRVMKALSGQQPAEALKAIATARAAARAHAWSLAGEQSPAHGATARDPLVVDLDATLVTAHSEKEHAAPTWKKGYGFHPLTAFLDHGADGTGEPLAVLLRPGNAGSNTAADHITVTRQALAQLPRGFRSGRKVMIRTDSAGGTKDFLHWLTGARQNLGYTVGFPIGAQLECALPRIPEEAWARAYNSDGHERDGAWVAEVTGMLDLSGWPEGMRVIVRREVPHVGAQLRITDLDGMRYTAFATNQAKGQLADLEVRRRLRARCEDRIRGAKDTGLSNLPLHAFDANTLWCHLVMLAAEITAWAQMLALHGHNARRWEPKRLRARIFETAARISRHARRTVLHLAAASPETPLILTALGRLALLAPP
ncbi:IS1380 family transposase [Sinomonas halotolerans]|uniref:IS1380 family transposase n=1 Tax=Sinomonas halotolerans TaxID=1644133 RepID=A0ABU9X0N2_9MICC